MQKAIATPPGEATIYADLTLDELADYEARNNAPPIGPSVLESLEAAFLQFIPNHQGESYLTGAVKALVWTAKPAVTEAIKAGALVDARDIIESLTLPPEMQSDQQTLINQLNSLIGA